jgi:hypothetical protein
VVAVVTCALCGARRRNDESVVWIGASWGERMPYCAGDCANRANPNTCVHEQHLALCKRCEDADKRARARWV